MTFLTPDSIFLICASLCATAGAVFDLRSRRIPNLLTGPSIFLGLLIHLAVGGWLAMAMSFAACLMCGAIFFVFFLVGGMGAGDIKLMAAVGSIAGFGHLTEITLATVLMGGIFAAALALYRGRLKSALTNVGELIAHHGATGLLPHPELNVHRPGTLRLPYGMAIATGCWIAVLAPSLAGMR